METLTKRQQAAIDAYQIQGTPTFLIKLLTQRQPHLKADDVDLAVKSLLDMMASSLAGGERTLVLARCTGRQDQHRPGSPCRRPASNALQATLGANGVSFSRRLVHHDGLST